MQNPTLTSDSEVLDHLRAEGRGQVIAPGDAEYDAARAVYFTGLDRRPAAVVRPVDAAGVARVVTLVRDAGLPLAVRSGGHSPAGHGVPDDGIVLDLSAMRRLEIDPAARTAWAETGLTAGAYTAAVGEHGLATGFGDSGGVGIGGITLGGGVGFLHRKLGLTADSLLAAEVATADGEIIRADAESNQDLFWAIRGGGGNFGVATRFLYRLHPVDEAVGGMMAFRASPEVIADFLAAAAEAPDELSGMIGIAPAPPLPFLPAEHHGKMILMAMLVHAGPIAEGERVVARLRAIAPPIIDQMKPLRYAQIYEGPKPPQPARFAVRSLFRDDIDRAAARTILDALEWSPAPMRVVQLRVLGGAVARVPVDATAFAHRDRRIMAIVGAIYEEADEAEGHEAWAGRLASELRQGVAGAYVGFMGDEGPERVREAYPGTTGDRLAAVKARYDPTNLFRFNQNVPPSPTAMDPPSRRL